MNRSKVRKAKFLLLWCNYTLLLMYIWAECQVLTNKKMINQNYILYTQCTHTACHAVVSPHLWSCNFSDVYTSPRRTFSPLSRLSSSPEQRIKTSRSSEACNHICLPAVVYVSDPALASDFELLQNTSESCMEPFFLYFFIIINIYNFFLKLSQFAKLWFLAAKNSRHGFRHPQPPHLAENVNVHDDGKLWLCRLDFDEPNCLSLPCHWGWSVYTENKPRTLDSNCVVGSKCLCDTELMLLDGLGIMCPKTLPPRHVLK